MWHVEFCINLYLKQIFSLSGKIKTKNLMTPTWFEHAAFWSGVRRATVAPRSQMQQGSTEIWTRIAGFKVQSANHYTMEPPPRSLLKFLKHIWQLRFVKNKNSQCFLPGSNRRPCACEAHVITTTLRKLCVGIDPKNFDGHWISTFCAKRFFIPSGDRTQDLWIRSPTHYPLR